MTQEEKELLMKDLCARSHYRVICFAPDDEYGDIGKLWCIEPFEDSGPNICIQYPKGNTITKFCSEIKPYLRPMSSMTEEEENEYRMFIDYSYNDFSSESFPCVYVDKINDYLNWLNAHHFDYHGLIERGIALEAPEGTYN